MNTTMKYFLSLSVLLYLVSCGNEGKPIGYDGDTHGRGQATILIEESFKPLFDTSIYTFESQYAHADIVPYYKAEGDIINDFFANKAKTICISD